MTSPAQSTIQNLLPVQAYFDAQDNFVTFIGQNKPFFATANPDQSGVNITNSTINSTTIGALVPSTGNFTNISTVTGTISTAPSSATDIVNKQYVDYALLGLSWKEPARAATTTNITLSGPQTIDTVAVVAGDIVLVKDQTNPAQNGIYTVQTGAWTYAIGSSTWDQYIGAVIYIVSGGQATAAFYTTAQPGGTLGVTAMNWFNLSFSASYTAGTGLTLTGTQFSITNTAVTAAAYGSASKTLTATVNAQGQLTALADTNIAIAGSQITSGTTGTGNVVLDTSPTLVTPNLGTPSTLVGTNITGTASGLSIGGNAATATTAGSATTATNLAGGATGSLPYQSGAGATTFLSAGSNGQVLTLASGVPSWAALPASGVTSVTASAPLASSGGTTPNITITQSNTTTDGYLSSTDWNTFNGKANAGANSNITSLTGITGGIATPNFITFNTSYATALTAGQLGWESTNNSLAFGMTGGNIVQHIGEDQYLYIKASATITKGQVIMITGSVGASGVLTGAPATGITDGTYIIGVAAEAIANNAFGFVQTFGVLTSVNTSAFADGDILWYDPAVTGGLTATKPSAPNVKAQIAACNKGGSAGGGVITIRVNPGSQLGGTDSNVQFSSLASGQTIIYDAVAGYWENATLTAGTGISITNGAGSITIAGTGPSITDDTTTNATRFPLFTSVTTGSLTTEFVSSTKFQFNPSTGALTATSLTPTNPVGTAYGGTGATSLAAANIPVTNATNTFTAQQTFNSGNLRLAGSTSGNSTLNASAVAGTTTLTLPNQTGTLGYLNIPPVGTKTGSYTLATNDVGEYVQVGSGGSITIPNATFAEGDAISIFNNTTGNITITCTIDTAYIAGTNSDKASVTLATRGVATILFISSTVCVITGNVT
jgi:hypothetical protein